MKLQKTIAAVLAAVLLCAALPPSVSAAGKKYVWSDYIESVRVLDIDRVTVTWHAAEGGGYVYDGWYLPERIRFMMKDGSRQDVTVDTSGMQSVEDEVEFVLTVAPGVKLTFAEYLTVAPANGSAAYALAQKTGKGGNAEYDEIYLRFIDVTPAQDGEEDADLMDSLSKILELFDPGEGGELDLSSWESIIAFFKNVINTIMKIVAMFPD